MCSRCFKFPNNILVAIFILVSALWTGSTCHSAEEEVVAPTTQQSTATQSQASLQAQALKSRVAQYWQYKINGDYNNAYAFEDPESLGDTNLTDYTRGFGGGVKWLGADVEKVTIAGSKAKVIVKIRYIWTFEKEMPKDGIASYAVEYWQLRDGTWFHSYADPRKLKGSQKSSIPETGVSTPGTDNAQSMKKVD